MATIRKVVVNLTAGTAELFDGIEKSNAKLGQFGQNVRNAHGQVISSTMAASGAIRLLEGNFTNNIRAVEKFVAVTLGLGPALQGAFGAVGAIATAGIFVKMGEEAYKFFKEIEDGPRRIAQAFRDLEVPVQITNDQLALTKANLENTIAKLEGKPQNGMKVAILEAVAAADELGDALDKDLRKIADVLMKEKVGFLARAGGATGSKEILDVFGGTEGHGHGIVEKLQEIEQAERRELLAAQRISDKKQSLAATEAAEQKSNDDRKSEMAIAIGKLDSIATRESLKRAAAQKSMAENIPEFSQFGGHGNFTNPASTEESKIHQEAIAGIARLQDLQTTIDLRQGVTGDKRTVAKLTADNANNRFEKPAQDKINAMKARVEELKAAMSSIGQTDTFKGLVEGHANALKAIEQVNKALERFHGNKAGNYIAPNDAAKITDLAVQEKQIEVETAYRTKLDASTRATQERIASGLMLAAAIGQGYDATKKANVETQLMTELGREYIGQAREAQLIAYKPFAGAGPQQADANEIERAKNQANRRKEIGVANDVTAYGSIKATVDKLGDQIELETALLKVQEQGKEVIDAVTLAYRIQKLQKDLGIAATQQEVDKETELFHIQQARLTKTELSNLNDRIAATKALNATAFQGQEAQRKAGLQAKYDQMATHGQGALVPTTRTVDELEHQRTITDEAAKRVTIYRDQIAAINDQVDLLHVEASNGGDLLQIGIALKDLEDQRLKVLIDQSLAMGRAKDGMRAFFLEMQQQGEKTAKIIYDAMNSAVDKLSDNLAKLLTGQKTAWADMFKSIGTDLLKSEIKKEISKGIGDIGKLLGIKPDLQLGATPQNPMNVRVVGGVPVAGGGSGQTAGQGGTSGGGTSSSSSNPISRAIEKLREIFHVPTPGGQQDPWHPAPAANFMPSMGLSPALGGRYSGGPSGRPDDPVHVALDGQGQPKPGGVMSWLPSMLSSAGQVTASAGQAKAGFSGYHAAGGDIPSGSYGIAGEAGPEKIFGPAHVMSNKDSFGGGGGDTHNHYYTIDNRGAELGSENRMRQMLKETHSSAVSKSVQASAEREKRTVQRTR